MSLNRIRYKFFSPAKNILTHSIGAVIVGVILAAAMFWATSASIQPTIDLVGIERYTSLEGYASVINVAITIISVGIAWGLFAQAEASRKLNRKADVIISCIDRYERLSTFESQFGPDDEKLAQFHFSQYFALKSDQVDFYLAGWIDSDTFITWMRAMTRSWIKDRQYFGMQISQGWENQQDFHKTANSIFFQLMQGICLIIDVSKTIENSIDRDIYVESAFRILMIEFYDKTRGARRLLATDFEPARYFSTKPAVFNQELSRRLQRLPCR